MAVGVMEEVHSRSVGRPTDSPHREADIAVKLAILAAALLNVGTLVNVAQFFWNNPPGSEGTRHLPLMDQRADDLLDGSAADVAKNS
ncbi:hypothetical protein ACGFWI_07390 [Streptomyces sp. NPDC048434]|uniref:hypothetical protein n=1 Tax=Streptomyces sp. NPDC048434 TaxID=3365549 RepID=UPI0037121793